MLRRKNFGVIGTFKNAFTNKKKYLKSKGDYIQHLSDQFSNDFNRLPPEVTSDLIKAKSLGNGALEAAIKKHKVDGLDSYKKSNTYNSLINKKLNSINRDRAIVGGGALALGGLGYLGYRSYKNRKKKQQEEKQFSFLGRIGKAVSSFRSIKKRVLEMLPLVN